MIYLDDFCAEFIEDEQFKAAMSKLSVKPKQDKLDIEGIITHIQEDFEKDLTSTDDKIADIIQGGMSCKWLYCIMSKDIHYALIGQ